MRSLRRTLAVRFSLTMAGALLVIALWAYAGAQTTLDQQLERSLASALALQSAALAAGLPLPPQPSPSHLEEFVEAVNQLEAGRDPEGRVLATNTPLAGDLPVDSAALAAARRGVAQAVTEDWRGGRIRSLYAPVPPGARADAAVIEVAVSLIPQQRAQRRVLILMLGTVLLGTVATMFGAGWLASSAVAPVTEITGQAEAVKPGRTGQRITAHAQIAEFHGLVRVLNRMLERLDQALLAERRIVADVGHDLRTPVTAMRGEIEVALRGQREAREYRAVLESMLEEVNRLGSISDALVLLARVEAGDAAPEREVVDLAILTRLAVERARGRADGREIRWLENGAATPTTRADPRMLGVVLDQLLDNAIRHTPPGTQVDVTVAARDDRVVLSVADDGPGIAPAGLTHLFERFYRGDEARSRGAGAGLGLSVAAAIVHAHGGAIAAGRSQAGGLEITVSLPR